MAFQANLAMSQHQPEMWPAIVRGRMQYACLGGNHLTTMLRGFVHGLVPAPAEDEELQEAMKHGHSYVILKDTILGSPGDARLVSEWLNADQNQNSGNSEIHLLRVCQSTLRSRGRGRGEGHGGQDG